MGNQTIILRKGENISFTTNALTSGTYQRVDSQIPGTSYDASTIAVSSSYSIGPFNEDRYYAFNTIGGNPSLNIAYSGILTAVAQAQINGDETTIVTSNIGTVNSGITSVEYGDAYQHTTILTVNSVLPAIAGGAALSVGKLLYTFPAGDLVVNSAYMSMAITQTQAHINTDTPDVGLGTTIGSGAHALLSSTANSSNIITGQTSTDCIGTATVITVADQVLVIPSANNHTVYFNAGASWSASGDAAAQLTGTVILKWQFMA